MPPDGVVRPTVLPMPSDRAWIDPRLLASNLYTVTADVAVTGGAGVRVLTLDYDRWAVGFTVGGMLASDIWVSPWPDARDYPFGQLGTAAVLWFDQLTFGPVVGGEWYVQTMAPATVRVVAVRRSPGRVRSV